MTPFQMTISGPDQIVEINPNKVKIKNLHIFHFQVSRLLKLVLILLRFSCHNLKKKNPRY